MENRGKFVKNMALEHFLKIILFLNFMFVFANQPTLSRKLLLSLVLSLYLFHLPSRAVGIL